MERGIASSVAHGSGGILVATFAFLQAQRQNARVAVRAPAAVGWSVAVTLNAAMGCHNSPARSLAYSLPFHVLPERSSGSA